MNQRSRPAWGATDSSRQLPELAWLLIACGLAILFVPPFIDLARGIWSQDEYAHGPIILAVSVWLMYRRWPQFARAKAAAHGSAWPMIALAALVYVVGRSQRIAMLEIAALILWLVCIALLMRGSSGLRLMWFPLAFACFMIPWPATLVAAVTLPLKLLVSAAAANMLSWAGYAVASSGTILQVGQYQLLIADACAGLHSLFTLEALGLLYLNLVRHDSPLRNLLLAVTIVPIAFFSNVVRVVTLALITLYFGDAAGQGFIHEFSGFLLFGTGLLLIIGVDSLLRRLPGGGWQGATA